MLPRNRIFAQLSKLLIMHKRYLIICFLVSSFGLMAQQQAVLPNEYQLANYNPLGPTTPYYFDHLQELNGFVQQLELAEYLPNQQDSLVLNGALKDSPNNVTYTFHKDKRIATYQFSPRANNKHIYYFRNFKNNFLDSLKMLGVSGRIITFQQFQYDSLTGLPNGRKTTILQETREKKYPINQEEDLLIHEMEDQVFVYQNKLLIRKENTQRRHRWEYQYYPTGKLKNTVYYEQSNKMREEFRDPAERLVLTEQYNYSVDGSLLEINRDSICYDETGRLVQIFRWNASGQNDQEGAGPIILDYEYKKGRLALVYKTVNGKKTIQSQYFYNDKGLLIKQIGKQGETTWDYTDFDQMGNWTRRVVFTDGEAQGVHVRKMTYYGKK